MAADARELIAEHDRLAGERAPWEGRWQELTEYILPHRNFYASPGSNAMQKVFDSTAIWCNEVFAAGMHALLTSPYMRFFAYETEDARVNRIPAVRQWLDEASAAIYAAFANPRTGWMTATDQLYLDQGALGTAVMSILDSPRNTVSFATRHLMECVIAENDEGEVDTLHRKWEWTAKQAVQAWGDKAPPKVKEAYEKQPGKKLGFLHSVKPRIGRDPQRYDAGNKPFLSCYVSLEDQAIIEESGFDEFPYVVPRLRKESGQVWGYSCGDTAMPDIKQLQVMDKTIVKSAQKLVDPPLQVPDDGFMSPIRTLPGGLNYYRAGSGDRIEPIRTGGDVRLGLDMLTAKQRRIAQIFYVDLLTMVLNPEDPSTAGKGVTATWVHHWRDQAMQRLSPVLARNQREFLGRGIPRVARLLARRGLIRPPPEELQGQRLRLNYVSPIALMQRATELEAIDRWAGHLAGLAQFDPMAAQLMDVEAAGRLYAERLNVPQGVLRTVVDLQERRRQMAQAQIEQAGMAQAGQMAGIARDAGQAAKGFASALPTEEAA
jgi:hypothetical protein